MSGVDLIRTERRRQITLERWSREHDRMHGGEELALAGAVYALPGKVRDLMILNTTLGRFIWPYEWELKFGRRAPKERIEGPYRDPDRIYDLTRAGGLIAAEIDRLETLEVEGS